MRRKDITISLLYYNDQEHVQKHLDGWKEYEDMAKFQIIDDGSKIPAKDFLKDSVFPSLEDANLYRIEEDIAWNIPGARNLSATVCSTPYMLICDMDQVFHRQEMARMRALTALGPGRFYSFKRFSNDERLKSKCGRKTCGTMLVCIEDWWKAGGYDEDMVGNYGHNDPLFRRQLQKAGIKESTPEIYCEEISADCELNRKSNNKEKYHKKIKQLPRENWNCLRFNWKHERF
jgi:hypothetical protein